MITKGKAKTLVRVANRAGDYIEPNTIVDVWDVTDGGLWAFVSGPGFFPWGGSRLEIPTVQIHGVWHGDLEQVTEGESRQA